MHIIICLSKLTNIASDNGLSPGRRQAIIRINAGIFLILTLGTKFSVIFSETHIFSFKKMSIVSERAAILPRPRCVKTVSVTSHACNNKPQTASAKRCLTPTKIPPDAKQ